VPPTGINAALIGLSHRGARFGLPLPVKATILIVTCDLVPGTLAIGKLRNQWIADFALAIWVAEAAQWRFAARSRGIRFIW